MIEVILIIAICIAILIGVMLGWVADEPVTFVAASMLIGTGLIALAIVLKPVEIKVVAKPLPVTGSDPYIRNSNGDIVGRIGVQ
jgi:hypothetical protein